MLDVFVSCLVTRTCQTPGQSLEERVDFGGKAMGAMLVAAWALVCAMEVLA